MLTCMYSRVQIFVGEACLHSKETRLKPDFCLEFYPYKVHMGQLPQDGENGQNVAFFFGALL